MIKIWIELALLVVLAIAISLSFIINFQKLIAYSTKTLNQRSWIKHWSDYLWDLLMTCFYFALIGYLIFIYNFKIIENPVFNNQSDQIITGFKISAQVAIAILLAITPYPLVHCFLIIKNISKIKTYKCGWTTRLHLKQLDTSLQKFVQAWARENDNPFYLEHKIIQIKHFKKHHYTYFQISNWKTNQVLIKTLRIDHIKTILRHLNQLLIQPIKLNSYNDLSSEVNFDYQSFTYQWNLAINQSIDYYDQLTVDHLFDQIDALHRQYHQAIQPQDHFVIKNDQIDHYRHQQLIDTYQINI